MSTDDSGRRKSRVVEFSFEGGFESFSLRNIISKGALRKFWGRLTVRVARAFQVLCLPLGRSPADGVHRACRVWEILGAFLEAIFFCPEPG